MPMVGMSSKFIEGLSEMQDEMKLNWSIARAATSWSSVFSGRKEVDRDVAVACRGAMRIAYRDRSEPAERLETACDIRGMDVDYVLGVLIHLQAEVVGDDV